MRNVQKYGGGGSPAGGCRGVCLAIGPGAADPETISAHDEFVQRFEILCAGPAVALLETLVFATGPSDEWCFEGGTPHPFELMDFVAQHNWPDPAMAARLGAALTELVIPLRTEPSVGQGPRGEVIHRRHCGRHHHQDDEADGGASS